jgi:hypothetical protein
MSEPAKLIVPAAAYDEALAFCRERQTEAGLPLWDALPAGMRYDAEQCPCAQAVPGLRVFLTTWRIGTGLHRFAGSPRSFVEYFDVHTLPDTLTLPVRGED